MGMLHDKLALFVSKISPSSFYKVAYFHHRHRFPNLHNPKDLSELWIKYVLDGNAIRMYYLADKIAVREYVKNKGMANLLTPLICVYDSPNNIKLSELPDRFALKANFGAGMNLICTEKKNFKEEDVIKIVDGWLKSPKVMFSEDHYNYITRKAFSEEFIDDSNGGFPVDYKFLCIKGHVVCILCCSGRKSGHADYIPYSIKWEPKLDYVIEDHDTTELLPAPKNLTDMIAVAEKLAEGIDLVRVDLYSNGERVWFGEMTLSPDGCIFRRWTRKAIDELGYIYRTC